MHVISVTMHNNSVTTKVAFFLGGREDVLPQRLQCDAASVGVLSVLFSTGSPFGHHPRLSMVRLRRRREYLCVDAAEEERWYEHLQTYAICKAEAGETPLRAHPLSPEGTHHA